MKTREALLFLLIWGLPYATYAQAIEEDDLYFNSHDRATWHAAKGVALSPNSISHLSANEVSTTINPSESYSARNINPEYVSGMKVGSNVTSNVPYFIPNYQPLGINQNLSNPYNRNTFANPFGFNNNCAMSGYGGYMMSPYYGGYANNAFYGGMSVGLLNSWGSPSSTFWNNYYYNPYYYGGGWGYSPYATNSYYYSPYYTRNVIVVRDETPIGKRPIGSYEPSYETNNRGVNGNTPTLPSNQPSGADATYYDRSWKQNTESSIPNRGSWGGRNYSDGTGTGARQDSWFNHNNSWNNSKLNTGEYSNGGRSSGFSGGGDGGSGGRRGRD